MQASKAFAASLICLGIECCYELKSGISFSFVYSFLGDCSLPPDVPNAQAALGGLTSFPEKRTVTYKCNRGFVKVPGKADSVICENNKWSELAEFCNRKFFISFQKSYGNGMFLKFNFIPLWNDW